MGRNPTGLQWGRDPRARLDPGQKSFAHSGAWKPLPCVLLMKGFVLEWAIRRERRENSPLQGQLRTDPISVVRGKQDDNSAKLHSVLTGSFPVPSSWLNCSPNAVRPRGCPSDLHLIF